MRLLRKALETIVPPDAMVDQEGWIGFDLDGTAAHYDGWKGVEHIGEPIPKTIKLIQAFLAHGVRVKFLTARMATDDEAEKARAQLAISTWSKEHIGHDLEATCIKDRHMVRLYDDRARQVLENDGELITATRVELK